MRTDQVLLLTLCFLAVGCSVQPDCGSPKIQDLVIKQSKEKALFRQSILEQSTQWRDHTISAFNANSLNKLLDGNMRLKKAIRKDWDSSVSITLSNIVTVNRNESTGNVVCRSEVNVDIPKWGGAKGKIKYRVEKTSEGEFLVTLM